MSYILKPSTSPGVVIKILTDSSIQKGPDPVLDAPVKVNPEGQSPVEEVEKTFLQKYWVYILPLVFIFLTYGGGGGGGEGRGE